MKKEEIVKEILELKKKRNAVIVAHNYQVDDVQEVADVIGDSLALSKYCADVKKDVIVFCGVHFMAESAKILSPDKIVLLPEIDAGCPMADMVTKEALIEEKKKHPNATVVCYINSSAEVKSECDICCTSSNAVNIVRSVKSKDILFVPDMNLGSYVAKMVPDKNIILWEGYCITHHRIKISELERAKELRPNAKVLVHPECQPDIVAAADFVGSTKQIIDYAANSPDKEFIIGTEMGVLFKLKRDNPDKSFYLLSQGLVCPNMKKTSLLSVYRSLKEMNYEINLDETIRLKAKKALDNMLEIS
ncbi:quinolinate synthase NadA [Acetivibrio clariflavus]|uniref:Quinolinate synthase n=1 Tax=Acetivibrio clariflavus (strain DSM 19732 / NBRC 101661 / EBR45) TaxID=720554 RepID=G8LUJ3_ACECE|nr:quinolinate synthase NadA [Acetivibrio clariflavus]AEV70641.1 quinolinate synthetase [Acetivibrio clariflavus DSM 19732]